MTRLLTVSLDASIDCVAIADRTFQAAEDFSVTNDEYDPTIRAGCIGIVIQRGDPQYINKRSSYEDSG